MTGRYKAYSEYQDSGIDWLHDIPTHWKTIPVGRCYNRVKRTGYESEELLSVYRDYGVIPKSSRDDNNNKPSDDLSPYQLVCKNNLVMNKMKAWQGSIAISEFRGIVSPAYFVYEPLKQANSLIYPRYVHYLLRHPIYINQYMSRSKGIRVNQWDLDPDEFQRIELLLPEKDEQEKIINFLDHETAKIDTLIAKQEKLIGLLKEKRQAVISHAVTKGLNPDAPMRDSGVEWLGEVPEHWSASKLKFNCILIDGDRSSVYPNDKDLVDCGIPFVSSKNIINFCFTKEKLNYISEEKFNQLNRGKLLNGDLVITVRGTIGHVAIFDSKVLGHKTGFINAQMMIIRPTKKLTNYLMYVSESNQWKEQLNIGSYGSTVKQLSNQILGNVFFSLPPQNEINDVVGYLNSRTSKIDHLIKKASNAIDLMKERKTAMISATVTGKIDVRDWKGD
ncbi:MULTISPECIES: restriction endonuclease subunit S [unclassified Pseudoalteromonas]|uniref:restriction endonuclease subunit S n=1 Tax=unclassified Pseudoalteromonas TaxID=194690 RepID=UPI0025B2A7B2|nr:MULTISPECIES: restriction endonuclease subunit S [unclassified Pseudoalteromonas]MDN3432615.1 restriction endonuclease subunit S [Pseudoalteromonas sp. APC 3907]MDN3466351.1 restriction endonuclease subunit S [Pseudoalteromonas sp. APC 3495]